MYFEHSNLRLSASDLIGHLNCRHLSKLELAVARGELATPSSWNPELDLLRERGSRHEAAYVHHLRSAGHSVVVIPGHKVDAGSVAATAEAMRAGTEIIVQAALRDGTWGGRADVLKRVSKPSTLGNWSYEIVDTKLARETKGGTVLQLCLYSDLVASMQGVRPDNAYVVAPHRGFTEERFRLDDYAAYARLVKQSLVRFVAEPSITYPLPIPHCGMCRWHESCEQQRRRDDHLSLVAGMSAMHAAEFARQGITSVARLAVEPLPLSWRPEHGSAPAYERLREQARVQIAGRDAGGLVWEAMPLEAGLGLDRLPPPSPGDIFFDLEGDPFVDADGREYLFGFAMRNEAQELEYESYWALTSEEEKTAFERFVDMVQVRRRLYPDLHIYHYAAYEPGALKRLMGRYATREEEIDDMLRHGLFVDLYAVLRRAIRASVESYSLKKIEGLYSFARTIELPNANRALFAVQAALEAGGPRDLADEVRRAVAAYNSDDCLSVASLQVWLERVRDGLVATGLDIPRPASPEGAAPANVTAWQARVDAAMRRLLEGLPLDAEDRSNEQHASWVLAHILDWHRRENKAKWWEFFRLREVPEEDLIDESAALAGLRFVGTTGGTLKAPVHRYSYPPQDADVRDLNLFSPGGRRLGTLEDWDSDARTIDIKKRGDTASLHPTALFGNTVIGMDAHAESLMRTAEFVLSRGWNDGQQAKLARDLLLRRPPDLGGAPLRLSAESPADTAVRIAPLLRGVLPIQGPPGAGKTHVGAQMIVALIKAGKTVGITANSHKVILGLVDAAITAAADQGVAISCVHKDRKERDPRPHRTFAGEDKVLLNAIGSTAQVISGTSWLWSPPAAAGAVDVLFVDEAAQMSLANVLAVSQGAKGIVLLGDPRQLQQPTQGSHPEGTEVSALDYVLNGRQTIEADKGLFLDRTWRLHPDIASFTSELFYENRLEARPENGQQRVISTGGLSGSGLRYLPVRHASNQTTSPEEAAVAVEIVRWLLASRASWIDSMGEQRPLTLSDIMVITPFNAQVAEVERRLPGVVCGTVDRFQGQQAAIVIYSVTSSSAADAPHGMEFIYNPNRLNVATSRAKCMCIMLANPAMFEPACQTPKQIQLANGYCRYLELAWPVEWRPP